MLCIRYVPWNLAAGTSIHPKAGHSRERKAKPFVVTTDPDSPLPDPSSPNPDTDAFEPDKLESDLDPFEPDPLDPTSPLYPDSNIDPEPDPDPDPPPPESNPDLDPDPPESNPEFVLPHSDSAQLEYNQDPSLEQDAPMSDLDALEYDPDPSPPDPESDSSSSDSDPLKHDTSSEILSNQYSESA
ncbi:hypothetical protein AVEN_96902-1 [Araneus ventricosus]|uniref:Uncharacterized protein n=1 Tax=Araneus ventricosus TaxID=182803 RepID=A0A4Y2FWU3_ARAVE|nr:hypothetical protein AVEN_96902-1 [Araneus ventricosus]